MCMLVCINIIINDNVCESNIINDNIINDSSNIINNMCVWILLILLMCQCVICNININESSNEEK